MGSKKVKIPGWEKPAVNAARWLRQHKNIPEYEVLEDAFAEYFNCRIIREPLDGWDYACVEVYAEFDEDEATMFLLRWA
jgi:hypothetical protein